MVANFPLTRRSLSLGNYLGLKDLTEHLKLTRELTFHWANWDQTCLIQRQHYTDKDLKNNTYLLRLNDNLQELKSQPIWLCNKTQTIQTDLYSLYESYLDSRLRLTWFDREDEILFSYYSRQGPFHRLTSMKWLDDSLYSQFVIRKILLENYTLRSFRINSNIPIVLKLNNDYREYENKMQIHQFSEVGFIFKITDKKFLNKFKSSLVLDLKIPIRNYQQVEGMSLEESLDVLDQQTDLNDNNNMILFKLESRILNFYGNMDNSKRSSEKSFCIFARYEDLIPDGHDVDLKKIFTPLIFKTKDYFLLSMKGANFNNQDIL